MSRIYSVAIACCALALMGCPARTKHPVVKAEHAIQPEFALEGTWVCKSEIADASKISISGAGRNLFNIKIEEKNKSFVGEDEYLGWFGKYRDHTFFILQSKKSREPNFVSYHAALKDKNTIDLTEPTLMVEGIAEVTSTEAFQQKIDSAMSEKNWLFALEEWRRQ